MARRRNVYALRQALAKDINDQNDFRIADFTTIIRDVIGASSGVVAGLEGSYAGQVVTITAGSITDSETIFELLEDTDITIPTVDANYKIYGLKGTTNDLPISGFRKTDIETGAETYDTVNSRTYDSITLGYTTGVLPINTEIIGTVDVVGGVITAYNDERNFITIANLTAYSLQNFSANDINEVTDSNYYTLKLGDLTNHYAFKVDALNTNATTLFKINNGTNSSNIAFEVQSSGNTSYKSLNGNNAIGFSSIGSSITGTVGFRSNNNLINFDSTLLANTTGLKVAGVNNGDTGITITDANSGIIVENESQLTGVGIFSKAIHVKAGASADANNTPLLSFEHVTGVYTSIKESGIGFLSEWKESSTISESFIGFRALNNGKTNGSIGFASLSNSYADPNDISLFDFEYGFLSTFSNLYNFYSLQNKNSGGFYTEILQAGDNNSFLNTFGFKANLNDESTGIIIESDGTGDNTYGIIGSSSSTAKFYKKFIEINNAETAIDIVGNTTNSVLGVKIVDNTGGILIQGKSNATGYGIAIDKVLRAIDINNLGSDDVAEGLVITQTNKPIIINNTGSGGFSSSEYGINLNLNAQQYGVRISLAKGSAIKLENVYNTATFMSDIAFSENNTNPIPHMTTYNTPTNLPVTTYFGGTTSVLQFYNNGSINQLKFWDGATWRTVDVT